MLMTSTTEAMAAKVKITFLCESETKELLEAIAQDEGRTVSNLVERLVLFALKQQYEKK